MTSAEAIDQILDLVVGHVDRVGKEVGHSGRAEAIRGALAAALPEVSLRRA